jgi:DNA-binding NtrC family response regulator
VEGTSELRLLLVDDERDLVASLSRFFRLRGFEALAAYCVREAIAHLESAQREGTRIEAVITDLRMPDGDGLAVVRAVRRLVPGTPVIVLTAFGSVSASVEAMRLGAVTMLEKPIAVAALEKEVREAIAGSAQIPTGMHAARSAGLVGTSAKIRAVFDTIVRVAPTTTSVLITGESGTGKELVAQAIHRFSRRAGGPLVTVNCAAIPEQLLESELFGHERGAFTGAVQARAGKFRLAHGGTIFLDEIGEIPLALQGKLLRVLQERAVEPLGSGAPESADFRVVAATNQDIEALVEQGKFRRDLYYRINVVPLALPPLRERAGDVPLLAQHFLAKAPASGLTFQPEAMAAMERYSWPGNVRELQNLVERLAVLKGSGEIAVGDLPPSIASAQAKGSDDIPTALPPEGVDLYAVLADLEDRLIREALERVGGNKNQAAKILGLNRTTLVEKLKKRARSSES